MTEGVASTLRERTRRAVQAEVVDAALALFAEYGFENVTVEQIAGAVGMSRRSFHRYFSSKDEVVLGKYDALGDQYEAWLRERPNDEPIWDSLRHVFEYTVEYLQDEARASGAGAWRAVIQSTPALRAANLERMQQIQFRLAAVLRERAPRGTSDWTTDDPTPEAIVAAAFACLTVASRSAAANGVPLGQALDRAMAALRPSADS